MDINDKLKQVPFGNSIFQNINFVANQESPERSYRHILLQLDSKNKAMKECYFRRKRIEVDLEEINEKLLKSSGYEKIRLEIDKEEKEFYLEAEMKLIEDCVIEIKTYEHLLSKMPDYSREDFENSESLYWEKRLTNQANLELASSDRVSLGTLESLNKIGCYLNRDDKGNLLILKNKELNNELAMNILEFRG